MGTEAKGPDPGVVLRRRMHELGLSQKDLGLKVGRSQGWVSQELLKDTEKTIKHLWAKNPDTLRALLNALQWTPEDFTRETGIELPGAHPTPLERMGAEPVRMVPVPILGLVSAGRGRSEEEFMGYVGIPEDVAARYPGARLYALRVDGDSMFCEDLPYSIPPGAYVVVCPDIAPNPGDVVVAWDEENEVGYLKEYRPRKDGYQVLRSWNPEVPPIVVKDAEQAQIRGVVVFVGYDPRKVSTRWALRPMSTQRR